MRIGFVGTGGVGKTTVLMQLQDLGLPVLESVVRKVFTEWGWREEDQVRATPEQRWLLQKEIFDRKVAQDRDFKDFITDRTLIDHLVYCLYRNPSISTAQVGMLTKITQEGMRKYDAVFYFPIGLFEPPDDGMRQNEPGYRMLCDAAMRGFLDSFGIGYIAVPAGTPEERADFVRGVINDTFVLRREGNS